MLETLQVINENIIGSFYSMDEAVQSEVAEKVLDKVFALTIGKYNKIDFGDIEKTRGDITKLKFYKNLTECIITLKEIDKVTKKISDIYIIEEAINNIRKLKPEFEKSFRVKNNSGIMIYNLITHAIMESTSYIIATAINFLSDDKIIISDVNGSVVLVDSLTKFNKLVGDGSIYKFISEADKVVMQEAGIDTLLDKINPANNKLTTGLIIGGSIIILMIVIVPLIRNLTYYYYNLKHKISESAYVQAAMLEMNIKVLTNDNGDAEVIAKQQKMVNMFKKMSQKFALESDKAERDTELDIKNDKIDINSVVI